MSASRMLPSALCAVLAACGGVLGGAALAYVRPSIWPAASAAVASDNAVTAAEFDLVDKDGKTRGRLFMAGGVTPTLALYDFNGKERILLKEALGGASLTLTAGNNEIYLSADDYSTGLWFNDQGSARPPRFTVQIWSDSATLSLSGADHKTNVSTYIDNNGAAISLTDHSEKQRAVLGTNNLAGPHLTLSDENELTRAELRSNLSLLDEKGNLRTVVGSTVLKNTKTGSTENLSPSSLVLFGENGHLLWQAP